MLRGKFECLINRQKIFMITEFKKSTGHCDWQKVSSARYT